MKSRSPASSPILSMRCAPDVRRLSTANRASARWRWPKRLQIGFVRLRDCGVFVAAGLTMYNDLSEFLNDLDKRKLLARISDAVNPDLEIAAVTDRACKSPHGGPALLFEKPLGFDIPVASNVFGSLERMCLALGVKRLDDLAHEIDEL